MPGRFSIRQIRNLTGAGLGSWGDGEVVAEGVKGVEAAAVVVMVGAEINELGVGVAEQASGDGQDRAADGDQGGFGGRGHRRG